MCEIIEFPKKKDPGCLEYTIFTDINNKMGIHFTSSSFDIYAASKNKFFVAGKCVDREALSEFLWAAAFFVDSERRYLPAGKNIPTCEY